jgi:broad specificity phosphatase PhoE
LSCKKIYLIRHGETDFNLQGIVQGSGINSSLNENGRAQALAFYSAYKSIKFDRVYTSKLKRTTESVANFIQSGIPQESLSGLNEISWGEKEGQKITPEEDEYYHWMLRQWQLGKTSERIAGGESPEDVIVRQKPAMDYVMGKENESTILICMHGRAIRILLCHLLHYPLRSMDLFEHQNLCLYVLNHTGSMFTIERHNEVAHLQSLVVQSAREGVFRPS